MKLKTKFLKKYWIEILIILIPFYIICDSYINKDIGSKTYYPIILSVITLLLVSIRTRVLLEDYKEKVRGRVFTEYHKLIRVMNGVEDYFDDHDKTPAIEVQCAAIFELRNYPEYKDFTYRTLGRWKQKTGPEWDDKDVNGRVDKILEELKKNGSIIPVDIKEKLNPLLADLKNKTNIRYHEEINDTLKNLGFDTNNN